MHYPYHQELTRQRTGSISDVLAQNIIKDVSNDGAHYTNWKEIEPESQMPCSFNQEVIIRLTDADLDITQMNETFLSLNVQATLNFSQVPYTTIAGTVPADGFDRLAQDIQRGMFLFVGLKNGSDIIRDYTIYHRGLSITNSLQNDATIESALYHVVEDKASKNNKKHVHSLYSSVVEMDTSVSGVYISYTDLMNIAANGRNYPVNIPVNIPITDLLPFQAFTEYPNNLFGELKIKFRINPDAFVFAQVDPKKSAPKHFYTTSYQGVAGVNPERINAFLDTIPISPAYDRGFFQFGTTGAITNVVEEVNVGTIADPVYALEWDNTTQNLSITMPNYTINRCNCIIRGFKMDKRALEVEREKYSIEPFVVPAQRIEISTFPIGPSSTELKTSQNIALRRVVDFMLLFPKYPQQITCWENPMLQNLHLNTCGYNYPEKSVSTIDPNFVQMQLQAADLSSFNLEATDEFEDSLVSPRATADTRLVPHTDLTSFVITIPVERSSGAGIYFDGLDTKGQNVSVELRANPIYQGNLNTYYIPNPTAPGVQPPPPVLAMVSDTYWLFSAARGGICHYEIRDELNEVIERFRA